MQDFLKPTLDPCLYTFSTDDIICSSLSDSNFAERVSIAAANPHAPCIIDRTPLEPNDSLCRTFPDLPDRERSKSSRMGHESRVMNVSTLYSSISPRSATRDIDIESCISPRSRSSRSKSKRSQIPDFTEAGTKFRYKPRKKKKRRSKMKKLKLKREKKKSKKYSMPRIRSPVTIDEHFRFEAARDDATDKSAWMPMAMSQPTIHQQIHVIMHPTTLKVPNSPHQP
eukprot:224819_1